MMDIVMAFIKTSWWCSVFLEVYWEWKHRSVEKGVWALVVVGISVSWLSKTSTDQQWQIYGDSNVYFTLHNVLLLLIILVFLIF